MKSIFGASRLFRVHVCSHFDGECVICGAGMKDTWLSRGSAAPRYPYWSLQQLCGLMAPLPRGVYWWLPLIPFSWKKHTRRDLTACVMCVCVCMCRTVLSVPSHTPVVTVIPGSKIGPVARQPCHPRSRPISILHLEERGLRSLRQRQVDQKKKEMTDIIRTVSNGAQTKLRIFMFPQKYPSPLIGCLFFAVLCRIYACFSD